LHNGTIVGDGGIILNTTDGGNNWIRQNSITPNDLYNVFFTDAYNGTAVGEDGTIINTSFPGVTSIESEIENKIDQLPSDYLLSQNYPNPFNPTTSLQYTIGSLQFVTLKVYDVLGREVAMLVNEEKQAGEYEVEFNAANLPSGIYFYQLKAGQYSETKKMVLLK